ncbi:MAG: HDOD domain-containing protein [Ideonella sp.]|nr:HDOD domain-containing protein [Ideonella sp.]
MNAPPDEPFITSPLPDVATWVAAFQRLDIAVLADTSATIEELRPIEESVDAHMLSDALGGDPLMTLKVLRHVAALRSARATTDAETVTAAVVLLGITPFFRAFQSLPTVEQRLSALPGALGGLMEVLRRSHRSAQFALGFAVHRMDHDAAVIHEAALLHDFAEMLLWLHAPSLALSVQREMAADASLRTVDAQRKVLNVPLPDVQQALMRQWRLPELLVRISDDHASVAPQVRSVQLAIRIARHSAQGWDNPALPDDFAELGGLLNLGLSHVQQLLLELDA